MEDNHDFENKEYENDNKFLRQGPQILDKFTQRTSCNLMLFYDHADNGHKSEEPADRLRFLRGGKDLFPYGINFADLPFHDKPIEH